MKKKLIVNADDYGYSRGINLGIVDAHMNGIVTSTTMLTTMPGFDHGVELAEKFPSLDIGIHLSADLGTPVSGVDQAASMVDENGVFIRHNFSQPGLNINEDELYMEWKAQINKALDAGIKVSHLDSHHHAHMHPELFPTFIKLAKEFDLPVRFGSQAIPEGHEQKYHTLMEGITCPDHLAGNFYADSATLETLDYHMALEGNDSVEIMCHPAYLDDAILKGSSYNTMRTIEIDILLSQAAKDLVDKHGFELSSFSKL